MKKKIFLIIILVLLFNQNQLTFNITKFVEAQIKNENKSSNGSNSNEDDSDSCDDGYYPVNGKCRRCMEDYCVYCTINECIMCAPPYKLEKGKCKLSSKTITWIILMYLLIIVIVTLLIFILVLPNLKE
jgi:hypothetical protein